MSRNSQKSMEGKEMRKETYDSCPREDKEESCGVYTFCPVNGYWACEMYKDWREQK